jgi:3-oxoacyl-[acyl-carrier protein] reductase
MNSIDLRGQVAVITGGLGGIGLATAERMLACGAKVHLLDVNAEKIPARADDGALSRTAVDLLDEAATRSTIDAIAGAEGRIDILVNSVGVEGFTAPIDEYPRERWDRIVAVNLTAPFLACKHVIPHMRRRDYGRIVNVSSVAGKEGNPLNGAYSASKAGVIALTKSIGRELARTGIRANCITPAAIDSDLLRRMPEDRRQASLARIPLGRFGETGEIAAMICWLASAECSFSTGAVFDATGGRSTY